MAALEASGSRKQGPNWRCPAHDDRAASLSIREASDGAVLVKCFSGCQARDVVGALGLGLGDLFPARDGKAPRAARPLTIQGVEYRPVRRYVYRDADGSELHWNQRYEPKFFVQGRWHEGAVVWGLDAGWYGRKAGKGDWARVKDSEGNALRDPTVRPVPAVGREVVWLDAARLVLYELPRVLAAKAAGIPVYLVDGEKDADAIALAGGVATCRPKGKKGWARAWTQILGPDAETGEGYRVIVVRDIDRPDEVVAGRVRKGYAGQKAAEAQATALQAAGIEVSVVEPRSGKDAFDHLEAGWTLAELLVVADWSRYEPVADQTVSASPTPPPSGGSASLHVVQGGLVTGSGGGKGADPNSPCPVDADGEWRAFELTDLGNAERLVHWHGADLRWCPQIGKWLHWDGARWAVDGTGGARVVGLAASVVRLMRDEAAIPGGPTDRKDLMQHAQWSEGERRIRAMVELAKALPGIVVPHWMLDDRRDLLACLNGTVDLRTGELREPDRADLLTRSTNLIYDPGAVATRWTSFLDEVTGGDPEVKRFLWKAAGYSLTGSTEEHCLFFLYGFGRNGKSTFVETLLNVMGDYAMSAQSDTLMVQDKSSQIRSDIARLKEARFVAMEETAKGARLDEGVVKWLTGGTTIAVRPLYKEEIEFKPQWKLWICGNHKPDIRGVDDGIWRRLHLVPFTAQIPVAQVDKKLPAALMAEAAGILAWMVAGAVAWRREGLAAPDEMADALAEYRDEMDVIGHFLRDETLHDPDGSLGAQELYERYRSWAKTRGQFQLSAKHFGMELRQRGVRHKRTSAGVRYLGLELRRLEDGVAG